jgi:hypothetical protein
MPILYTASISNSRGRLSASVRPCIVTSEAQAGSFSLARTKVFAETATKGPVTIRLVYQ